MLNSEEEIVHYFIENYNEKWLMYITDKKSMKSLWESLNVIGISQPSLSTLYSHHKMSWFSREKYISDFVRIQNIEKIMLVLNIKDEIIENALPDALKIYEEKQKDDFNRAYAAFRKKI